MIHTILVPLDGSTFAEQALPLAISLARRAGATLQLVHAHTPLAAVYAELQLFDATLDEQVRQHCHEYLDRLRGRIAVETKVNVRTCLAVGEVVDVLREQLVTSKADLMVMTTHARGPLGRFWLGSVADNLLRDVSVPLLLTHPREATPDFSEDVAPKSLLLPLDGSPLAEQILEPALNVGGLMDARYTLFRVVKRIEPFASPEMASMIGVAQTLAEIEKLHLQLKDAADRYLAKVEQRLRALGANVQRQVAIAGAPAAEIVETATPPAIDAIAIATHGRHGLPRFFLGSVTDKVVRAAQVPILVFRPQSN